MSAPDIRFVAESPSGPEGAEEALPVIAILVAARNEKGCLTDLLDSLTRLDYPRDRMEVWLGDDESEDGTGDLMEAWAAQVAPTGLRVHVLGLGPGKEEEAGKARVLAELGQRAQGELFLYTDADSQVTPGWARRLVEELGKDNVAIVSGVTGVRYTDLGTAMECVDWLTAQLAIWSLSAVGIPVTALGNNMGIRVSAYRAVGGFECCLSSRTEDYAIFRRLVEGGYGFSNLYERSSLIWTLPARDKFIEQRKRWMGGALSMPVMTQMPYWFQLGFYPVVGLLGLIWGWPLALGLIGMKLGGQTILLGAGFARLRLPLMIAFLPLYEVWSVVMGYRLIYHYLRDPDTEWKGRRSGAGVKGSEGVVGVA